MTHFKLMKAVTNEMYKADFFCHDFCCIDDLLYFATVIAHLTCRASMVSTRDSEKSSKSPFPPPLSFPCTLRPP